MPPPRTDRSYTPAPPEQEQRAHASAVLRAPASNTARAVLLRYGVALLSAVLAVFCRELLTPVWGHEMPYLTLFPAVCVSAWYGGLGPGLVTTALSAVAATYFWLMPVYSLSIARPADQVGLVLAVFVMLLIAQLTAALRRAREQLEQQVLERTAALIQTNANLQDEIAARRRMEQHLRERVEELETLWDLLPVAIWRGHDPACTIATGNRAGYELLRMTPGANVSLSAAPGERPTHYTMHRPDGTAVSPTDLPMQYAGAHGVTVAGAEYRCRFADGSPELSVYLNAKPLFDAQGQVRGSLGVFMDITARVQAETALRAAHEKLKAHIENTPLAVIEWDSECRVQEWSPHAERLLGWTAAEARGKRMDELPFIFEEDRFVAIAEMHHLIDHGPLGGIPQQVKTNRNRTKDGRVIHCQWYNSMLFDEHGQLRSILSLAHDVTARVEAEAVLHRSHEELERLVQERTAELAQANEALRLSALVLEHMAEGVAVVDVDTNEIVSTNPAFDAMCGYARGELLGQNGLVLNAYTAEENAQLLQALQEAARTSGVWTGQIANRKKDGTPFTSFAHTVLLARDGKQYWVNVQQDITARKQAEAERLQLLAQLESERARVTTILEQLPVGVMVADAASSNLLLFNPQAQQIWRTDALPGPVLGPDYARYQGFFPEGRPYRVEDWPLQRALLAGDVTTGEEIAFIRGDGTRGVMQANAGPVRDEEGQITAAVVTIMDVTAQKAAEDTLRQQALFFAHAFDAFIMTDLAGRILEWSPAAEQLYGYSRAEMMGSTPARLFPAQPHLTEEVLAAITERGRWEGQAAFQRKDGAPGVMEAIIVPVPDTHGTPIGAISVTRDISARKHAEEALRTLNAELEQRVHERTAALQESEARFRLLADSAPVLIWVNSLQGCEFVNHEYLRFLGVHAEADVRGYDWTPFIHPEDRDAYVNGYLEALAQRRRFAAQFRFRRHDGVYRWMHSIGLPRFDTSGSCLGYVGSTIDLTDLKAAEDAQRRLAAIVTSSEDAIISKTLDGIVTSWNAGAEQLFGYRVEEMIGQSIRRLIPAEQHAEEDEILARLRRGEAVQHFETVRRTKDGRLVDVSVTVSPIRDALGTIIGASKIARDITDRKRAEETLAQHARDLAHAHADLRQVAYVSAHDLQEPIRQIGIYTQHIAKQYGAAMDADMQDAIAFIVEGTKRMQAQFTDLMHYLEMEDPGSGITTTDCDVVLQSALAKLRDPIASSGATIIHDPLPTLTANAKHLQLVFQELIDNALKFRNSAPPQVHVWAEPEEDGWRFAVRDNGIGIRQSGLSQLFGFFRKLQQRQAYPGTGMGLAICKKIVARHGGRIWIDSQEGEGTIVYFTVSNVGGGKK